MLLTLSCLAHHGQTQSFAESHPMPVANALLPLCPCCRIRYAGKTVWYWDLIEWQSLWGTVARRRAEVDQTPTFDLLARSFPVFACIACHEDFGNFVGCLEPVYLHRATSISESWRHLCGYCFLDSEVAQCLAIDGPAFALLLLQDEWYSLVSSINGNAAPVQFHWLRNLPTVLLQ